MLPRVLLAIQDPGVRKRLKEMFAGTDSLVSIVRATKDFWKRLSRESADFVFISRGLLPDPVFAVQGVVALERNVATVHVASVSACRCPS